MLVRHVAIGPGIRDARLAKVPADVLELLGVGVYSLTIVVVTDARLRTILE